MEPLTFFDGNILAIETSCDETCAAVVNGRNVLANVVATQIEMHQKWGGVVPEAAARAHIEALLPVIEAALATARIRAGQIQAVAVTNRPGLVGALSVGVSAAKAFAFDLRTPILGVHHLEGHLCSILSRYTPDYPYLSLIASGGHTELVSVDGPFRYRIIGETRDDAAGEAFDKSARLLGLGYPGGRAIQSAAEPGNPKRYPLPRGLKGETTDFSFSGLKTAVLRLVESEGERINIADAAASVQEAVVSVLAKRTLAAAESGGYRGIALVGGVAANVALRERLRQGSERLGIPFMTPEFALCTDNAAMIGLAASPRLAQGECSDFDLETLPNAGLP